MNYTGSSTGLTVRHPSLFARQCLAVLAASVMVAAKAAALEAQITTSRGVVIVDLDPGKAPITVANFVRFAEGGTAWLDPESRALHNDPLYSDQAIGRVLDTSEDSLFEIGAVGGDLDFNPGYWFPDELHPDLQHLPYVIAMAGDGPNTNGGRVYLTGSLAMPHRDGKRAVFGRIREGSSRDVTDSIIDAGPGATQIESVLIVGKETWSSTLETAEGSLPELIPVQAGLQIMPGAESRLLFEQPPRTEFHYGSSGNLLDWTPSASRFRSIADSSFGPHIVLDNAAAVRQFYFLALTSYPPATAQGLSQLRNVSLTIFSGGVGELIYHFDSTGQAGTFENIIGPGEPPLFTGTFEVNSGFPFELNPSSARLMITTDGLGGAKHQIIKIGWDDNVAGDAFGRHEIELLDTGMENIFSDFGTCETSSP